MRLLSRCVFNIRIQVIRACVSSEDLKLRSVPCVVRRADDVRLDSLVLDAIRILGPHIKLLTTNMIGADDRLQLVLSMLSVVQDNSQASAKPQLVGMSGMGGVGKTTLALAVYDEAAKHSCYRRRVYFDVGDLCTGVVGLRDKRCELIKKLSSASDPSNFTNVAEERQTLRSALHGSGPLLLVLDDVWTRDQLHWLLACEDENNLAVAMDNLADNSRVLLTSRDRAVVTVEGHKFIELAGLDDRSAEQLLLKEAGIVEGASEEPLPEDTIHSSRVLLKLTVDDLKQALDICSGLPLALQVLGRQLRHTRRPLQVLTRVPEYGIVLRVPELKDGAVKGSFKGLCPLPD